MTIERILLAACIVIFLGNAAFANEFLATEKAGRAPARSLQIKKSKVPIYKAFKNKNIPRLDIGEEPVLKAQSPSWTAPETPALPSVRRPASDTLPEIKLPKTAERIDPVAPVSVKSSMQPEPGRPLELKAIPDPSVVQTNPEKKPITELTTAERQLLESQILLEDQNRPQIALGLLVEILNNKKVQTEAQLTYAIAAQKLGLDSEFRSTLMRIAHQGSPVWSKKATEILASLVESLSISDMRELHNLVQKYGVSTDENDAYNFYRAKYFLEKGDLGQVEYALARIGEKSKYRADALLIGALASYRSGQISPAAVQLEKLLKEIPENNPLRSIGAITLARIQFQLGKYTEAADNYKRVGKSSPLFLQAMTEQAWAQVLAGDHEGAAGNMFSLHTDFFKNAFAPESYTARSVAYLNLCQFGDGQQVLNSFKRKYGPFVGRLGAYTSKYKSSQDDYDTVRTLLRNPENREVNGLPRSFIFEMARHPSFIKVQTQINSFEDEIERFNQVNLELIQMEKDFLRKQTEARDDLQKAKNLREGGAGSVAELKARIENTENRIANLKYQYELSKKARNLIKDARVRAQTRIEKEKVGLREIASKSLRKRLNELTKDITFILEQNDVLEYEILAGAGEHIREQAAGAKPKQEKARQPASDKNVKWSFKGEIWEDEIGHYRSSLKNVCTGAEDKLASH